MYKLSFKLLILDWEWGGEDAKSAEESPATPWVSCER